jgi:hypothetical protein
LETVGDLVEGVAKLQTRQKLCGKVKLKPLNCWNFNPKPGGLVSNMTSKTQNCCVKSIIQTKNGKNCNPP